MPDHSDTPAKTIGTRIAEIRAIRGLSLTALGQRAHVSASQLSRIERGQRHAGPGMVAAIARALGVGVSVLYGQPYVHTLRENQLDGMLQPIRTALDSWDLPPDGEPEPRPLPVLEHEVARLVDMRVRTEFTQIAERLPGLITEAVLMAQAHAAPGRARERAFRAVAEVARSAAIVAYRLGYMDLARLALARMAAAAPHSGDPRQVAIERYERAQMSHAESSRPDRAEAMMRRALRDLDDDRDRATRAVRGTLQLRAAMMAATQGNMTGAADWLGQAAELADQIGEETNDFAMAFGRLNVQLNRMAVLTAADDHAGALACAEGLRLPPDYPQMRAAGFWIGKARSQTWTADHDGALESLLEAKRLAPQMTRYHPGVHETVGTLLRARQRTPEALRRFARWSGV